MIERDGKTKNVRIGRSRTLCIVEKVPEAKLKSKMNKTSLKITPILIFNDSKEMTKTKIV